jgi:tetratricopeptide (TPR) repeat protein
VLDRRTQAGEEALSARAYAACLTAVIFAAAWLRWPLPGPEWRHVDERAFLLQPLAFLGGDFDPHFYNYPTLQLYLAAALYRLYHALFVPGSLEAFVAWRYFVDGSDVLGLARGLTTVMAVATVFIAALLGRRLYGRLGGLAAAALLAVLPLHTRFSHLAATDVPQALWTTLAVYVAVRIALAPSRRDVLLAGLCVGLAASTKYPGIAAALPVAVAIGWRPRRLLLAGASAAGALALTSPYLLLSAGAAWHDIAQMGTEHVGSDAHALPDGGSTLWHLVSFTLRHGLGITALATLVLALGWRARDLHRGEIVLLVGIAALAVLPVVSSSPFMRYAVPLAPLLAVLVGRPLVRLPLPRWAPALWLLLLLAEPAYASWQARGLLSGDDTLEQALAWLEARSPGGYRLIPYDDDWSGAPGFLTPSAILTREMYFRRNHSGADLRRAYGELARRDDAPPLTVVGAMTAIVDGGSMAAPGHAFLFRLSHPLLRREPPAPSRFDSLDWVAFETGDAADARFDPVDRLFLPVAGFDGVEATGPDIQLAEVAVGFEGKTPTVAEYFALRTTMMDARRAVVEERWADAAQLYDEVFGARVLLAEMISEGRLADLFAAAGTARFNMGQTVRALSLWYECLELRPRDGVALANVGGGLIALQRYDEAVGYLVRAAEVRSADADLHYNLGTLCLRLQRYDEGARYLARAVELRPDADGLSNLGWALMHLEKWADAARALRRALALQPDHAQARRGLALLEDRT